MFEILKKLCMLNGTSGDEKCVRDFIISQIDGYCKWEIDNLGNIIAFKEGEKRPVKKIMIDAHTDEVGLIVTGITAEGFLKFTTVGGIETSALMFRRVKLNGDLFGIICGKPVHLLSGDEKKKLPKADSLYIDIGATSKEEAEKYVGLGDTAVICGDYTENGDNIISKALDDRIGCAVLINLIKSKSEYDFYASFSVQEEVGLRGARVTAYSINPDSAIILEATTAADIADVKEENKVCSVGKGVAVSFMDKATVYDKEYYNTALNSGISSQPKCAVAGGNNSGAVHLSREGVRTIALSVPCRYIHTSSCVASKSDCENLYNLANFMLKKICNGEV